jgi:hypothetical protein
MLCKGQVTMAEDVSSLKRHWRFLISKIFGIICTFMEHLPGGRMNVCPARERRSQNFWFEYWCAARRSLIEDTTRDVGLINLDAFFSTDQEPGLERLPH